MVVFAADDDKGVGLPIKVREAFEGSWRSSWLVILESAFEKRAMPLLKRVNERHLVSTPAELSLDESGDFDALPAGCTEP